MEYHPKLNEKYIFFLRFTSSAEYTSYKISAASSFILFMFYISFYISVDIIFHNL